MELTAGGPLGKFGDDRNVLSNCGDYMCAYIYQSILNGTSKSCFIICKLFNKVN